MSKHKYKNDNWYKAIANIEKLTFGEARDLYQLYLQEFDIEKRKELRTRIIQGTLHIVLNFIQNSEFQLLHSSSYDMDDIINTAFEVWIRKIDEGELLKFKVPSRMLQKTFCSEMEKILVSDEYRIGSHLSMDYMEFIELLSDFIQRRNQKDCFHYSEFIKWIEEDNRYQYLLGKSDRILANEYSLLTNIYESFQKEEVNIVKTKIKWLLGLLIQNGFEYSRASIYDARVNSFEDEVVTEELNYNFLDIVFNQCGLTEIQKNVLKRRFGIDIEQQTLEGVGEEYNRSGAGIKVIQDRALRKLRGNYKKLRQFN